MDTTSKSDVNQIKERRFLAQVIRDHMGMEVSALANFDTIEEAEKHLFGEVEKGASGGFIFERVRIVKKNPSVEIWKPA